MTGWFKDRLSTKYPLVLLALLFAPNLARAQPAADPAQILPRGPIQPATLELIVPTGATASVDGRDAAAQRTFTFDQFATNQTQRVNVAVRFADGTEAQRLVELEPGRHVRVPVNLPPMDKPVAVVTESPAAMLWAAFSPDGRRFATASEDRSVVLWDFAAGRPVRSFAGHLDAVQSIAFSPDGELLLTASTDSTAVLWNSRTGKTVRTFKGHSAGVNSAVFSRDGKRIVTGSSDNSAILWDASTGAKLRSFAGHSNEVVGVAISADGHKIATASTDRYALLWDADMGQQLFQLQHNDTVSGVVFSSDGLTLATASFANIGTLWETATGRRVGATRRVNLDINGVALSPDDQRTFTAGKDATVKMWDAKAGTLLTLLREFAGHSSDVSSVTTSPDGRLLLTASRDGTARLWDIATGSELVCLASGNTGRSWAVIAPDGLFDASESGREMMGFRFAGKLPGAVIDQFFGELYHPGLLAEIHRGERPLAKTQLGRSLPPLVKIVSPKTRSATNETIIVRVDAADQGGGVSGLAVFQNGARIAVKAQVSRESNTVHYSFPMTLARGANRIRVTAAASDGSWESIPAETELNFSRRVERKSRLFVVAVGVSDYAQAELKLKYAAKDAQALAAFFQRQSAQLYERVDVIPLMGKAATRALIAETLKDVAALSQPHDAVMLLLCGQGALLNEQLYFAPQELRLGNRSRADDLRTQGIAMDDLAAILGTAGALKRVLMVDVTDGGFYGAREASSEFRLRGVVERWARSQGIYILASVGASHASESVKKERGLLSEALLNIADESIELADSGGGVDVMEWFNVAVRRAGTSLSSSGDVRHVQSSTQAKGFPLLVVGK